MGNSCCGSQVDRQAEFSFNNNEKENDIKNIESKIESIKTARETSVESKDKTQNHNNINNSNNSNNNNNQSKDTMNPDDQIQTNNLNTSSQSTPLTKDISLQKNQSSQNNNNKVLQEIEECEQQQQQQEIQENKVNIYELEKEGYQTLESRFQVVNKLYRTKYLNSQFVKEIQKGIEFESQQVKKGEILCSKRIFDGKTSKKYFMELQFDELEKNQEAGHEKQDILLGIIKEGQQDFWQPVGRNGCSVNLLNYSENSQMKIEKQDNPQINSIKQGSKVFLKYDGKKEEVNIIIDGQNTKIVSNPGKKLILGECQWRFAVVFDNVKCKLKVISSN